MSLKYEPDSELLTFLPAYVPAVLPYSPVAPAPFKINYFTKVVVLPEPLKPRKGSFKWSLQIKTQKWCFQKKLFGAFKRNYGPKSGWDVICTNLRSSGNRLKLRDLQCRNLS